MLQWRLLSGLGLAAILVLLIWLDLYLGRSDVLGRPALVMAPLMIIVVTLAAFELVSLWNGHPWRPTPWVCAVSAVIVVLSSFIPVLWRGEWTDITMDTLGWPLLGLAVAFTWVMLSELWWYQKPGFIAQRVGMSVLVMVYLGVLISFLPALRFYGDNTWGMVALLSVLAPVKASDSAAYFAGRWIGRVRLAPKLSPRKTVEGLLGGIVGGWVAMLIVFYAVGPWITGQAAVASLWLVTTYSVVVTLAGVCGDLLESMFKRDSGKKDSGQSVPGLGGVLDIIDSVLGAAPVALVFWTFADLGPSF